MTATTTADGGLTGFRRGAFGVYRVLIALAAIAIIVQIFLAGFGIFGAEGVPTDDDVSGKLDAHRAFGHILTQPVMLLVLIVALLARPGRKIVHFTVALFVLGIVQMFLAFGGEDTPAIGGLHAVNALLLLGIAVDLNRRAGNFNRRAAAV